MRKKREKQKEISGRKMKSEEIFGERKYRGRMEAPREHRDVKGEMREKQ